MKLGCRLFLLLLSTSIVGAGCGPSQADFDRVKRHDQLTSTERDNLKAQLDQATAKIQSLQQQVTTLQAQATAKPEGTDTAANTKATKKKHGRVAKTHKRSKKRSSV